MNIKKRIKFLHKIKSDYMNEYEKIKNEQNQDFQVGYLKGCIDSINSEINHLEDLWLEGVENV